MNTTHPLRPAWTPVNILLMIVGFAVFWPLGLFMIAYMIWGDEWGLDFSSWGNVKRKASEAGIEVVRACTLVMLSIGNYDQAA